MQNITIIQAQTNPKI